MLDAIFKLASVKRELGGDVVGAPWRILSVRRGVLDRLPDLEPMIIHCGGSSPVDPSNQTQCRKNGCVGNSPSGSRVTSLGRIGLRRSRPRLEDLGRDFENRGRPSSRLPPVRRAGRSGRDPVLMEIGRHLARVYEGYLGSPLRLLRQLDAREQPAVQQQQQRQPEGSDGK